MSSIEHAPPPVDRRDLVGPLTGEARIAARERTSPAGRCRSRCPGATGAGASSSWRSRNVGSSAIATSSARAPTRGVAATRRAAASGKPAVMSGGGRPSEGWLTIGESSADRAAAPNDPRRPTAREPPDGTMTPMTGPPDRARHPDHRRRSGRRRGRRSQPRDAGSTARRASGCLRRAGPDDRRGRAASGASAGVAGRAVGDGRSSARRSASSSTSSSRSASRSRPGLLVVAIFTGRFIGLFVRAGAGREPVVGRHGSSRRSTIFLGRR